jgi:hypothetical protein
MTQNFVKMSATNAQVKSAIEQVKKQNGEGKTLEASKALAAKLAEQKPAKAEPREKASKSSTAAPVKSEAKTVPLVAHIPLKERSKYQLRPYLHPSYNAPEWENKEPDLIALKTLYIDDKNNFQLWNAKTAVQLISEWISSDKKLKTFSTSDVEKRFKLFGSGVTDITRNACAKIVKDGKLSKSAADTKKKSYIFQVVRQ